MQKQLEEERQILELRQLQAASGQNVRTTDSSMDWMYEGPAAGNAIRNTQLSEEYLLGKIYKPQDTKTFDLSIPGEAVCCINIVLYLYAILGGVFVFQCFLSPPSMRTCFRTHITPSLQPYLMMLCC